MNILFLCFEYCGDRDPCSQCIHQLRRALYEQGVKTEVLTYAWNGEKEQPVADEYGMIYPTRTWYRYARVKRMPDGKIQMSPVQWAKVAAARGVAMLLEGSHYAQRGVPVHAANRLGKRLRVLCLENRYDWVVSVAYPFANHLVAAKWTPAPTKLAFYNLDPYWNNGTYPSRLAEARAAEEAAVYQKANCVFCTPEQQADYQTETFRAVAYKIHPLPYPKLVRPKVQQACPIQFNPECINLLYLGTVYGDIRKPEALFKLFQHAVEIEPKLRLYIVGKKFGADADLYLTEYKAKLGGKLQCYSPIPPEQTMDLLLRADVLVNMGNTVRNQMPSKILEYISTGKPILNLSVDRQCNTLGLMSRYPLCLQVFEENQDLQPAAFHLVEFCREKSERQLEWKQIEDIYPEIKLESVLGEMMQTLRNAK
ncbi:MAG: hypothetical protein ACLSWR_00435 [Ruthenibacterium sp.]